MRNFVLLFGILFIFANEAWGQTIVPDSTSVSGTWTRINSPYEINGLATVPMGQTLTIEPGVEIRFKTGTDFKYSGDNKVDVGHLTVQGRLIARGTSSQRIVFTRQGTSGNWGCIFITNKDSNSVLEYCTIQYANQIDSYDGAINIYTPKTALVNSSIVNNKSSGISTGGFNSYSLSTHGSTPDVRNCIIANNQSIGLNLGREFGKNDTIKLINNTIVGNKSWGLSTWDARCHVINSVFWGNSGSLSLTNDRTILSYTLVEEEDLSKFSGWLTIGKAVIFNHNPQLDSNFSPSFYSPCVNAGLPDTSGLKLPASDFAGNTRINLGVVDLGAIESTANKFVCITKPNGGEGYQVGNNMDICWRSNAVGVDLEYTPDGGATWKNIVSGTANDGHFAWLISSVESEYCNIRISDSSDNNIFDVCDTNLVTFSSVIPRKITLSGKLAIKYSPYIINGSIVIPAGDSLVIDPGTILKFKTVAGLGVKGKLTAKGTREQPIVFTRQENEGSWGCVYLPNTDIGSILEYCTIQFASGGSPFGGAITSFNRRLSLSHSRIINNVGNGVYSEDSYPEIRNCIIAFNGGCGLYLRNGNYGWPTKLINNSIVGNSKEGLFVYQTNCQISNSVFWGNAKSLSVGYGTTTISYSLIQEDIPPKFGNYLTVGKGMIYDLDPQFADLNNSDFHLKPTSPGIDQGDPLSSYQDEPENNGDRINLGAYGNTTEAEKTENLPRITWLSAHSGHMFGNDTIKIKGTNFLNEKQNGKILFDNTEVVKYLFWSNDSLVCVTPPHMPDTVSIFIINKDIIQGFGFECFTYKPPVISQNSPLFLKCNGNEKVSLNGKLFGLKQNGVHILLNKTEAPGYQSWNDSALVLTSPPNPEGLANLTFRLNDTIFYDFKGLFYYTGSTFTELCGNIPDTLKQGQAYLLNCSDTIPAGKTLIVQPGVVIIAKQNTKNPVLITVDGSIIAKGTANDSINFLSIPYEKNLWGGIRLTGNGAFGFCRIRNAGTGILQESGTSTIENSFIEENETGIYYYGDNKIVKSRIINCVISDNNIGIKAEASGNKSRGTAEVEVISSSVTGNKNNGIELSGHGYVTSGLIPESQSSTVYFTLKNSVISDNRGYAVSLYASGFTFSAIPSSGYRHGYARITSYNSIFSNNSKGITTERGNKNPQSTITAYFYNSNFWKNNSVFKMDANYVFFYNTNFWDDYFSGVPEGICDSLVFESCNLNDLNVVKTGNNNISSDPKYTSSETGDFSLQPGSPCIDAGNNKYVDFTTDFPGKARIWNATGKESAIVDIGAFEYNAPCFSITENISICNGQSYLGWTTSGKYQRTLHTGAGCDSVVNTILTVNPVYNITENKTICQGQSYQGWTTSGTYQRPLKSKAGCDSLVTTILTVILPPTLSSPLTGSVCTKNLFTYIPTSDTPGTTFTWKRNAVTGISNPAAAGMGTVSETLVNTYTYSRSVTYVYTLTTNGCTNTQNVVVSVNPRPYLSSSKAYGPVCNNTTFTYTPTSSVSSTTFSWTRAMIPGISNAAASGTVKISETLNNNTTNEIAVPYIIKLSAAGCDSFQIVTVTVKPTPVLSSSLTPLAICSGTLFNYNPTSEIIGTAFSWKRSVVAGISNPSATGAGSISETLVNTTAKPVTVTYEYTMGLTGCTSNKQNVSIVVNPVYNITENKAICHGQNYNGWTTSGTYKRTLQLKYGCDSTITTNLTVYAAYQPPLTVSGDTLKTVNLCKTYQWYNEAGIIAGATGNRHIISKSGKYHLVVTDENGCTNTSAVISAIWSDTREFISGEFMYSIIPNPGIGRFIFRMDSGHDSDITLQLINPAGQVIETRRVKKMTQNHTEQFDVSHLSKGIYLLVISSESFQTGEKIVVQ